MKRSNSLPPKRSDSLDFHNKVALLEIKIRALEVELMSMIVELKNKDAAMILMEHDFLDELEEKDEKIRILTSRKGGNPL